MTPTATEPRRALVISASPVGSVMSGPGIRAWEFAELLRPHAEVTLAAATTAGEPLSGSRADVHFRQQDPRALRPHIDAADVIVTQPPWPLIANWLRRSAARLIYDMYDPEPFELLAHDFAPEGESRPQLWKRRLWERVGADRVFIGIADADHILCSSERQRDMWIGTMVGEGLIDEVAYDADPSLRSLIDIAPFGLSVDPPRRSGAPSIRDRFPTIGASDEIVLWNGGIWGWLDAPTVVRAMAPLRERRPRAKLVFAGQSAEHSALAAQSESKDIAERLGLLDGTVFFNDSWLPYEQRANWLLDADCAVSAHQDNLETRFAFRTRLLDCFWAGLPIVCTEGDELSATIEREGLGRTVPPGDHEAMAMALAEVLERGRESYAEPLEEVAERFAWPRAAEAMVRFATSEEPPPRRRHRLAKPAPWARTTGFRIARSSLNAVGLSRWPAE